MTIDDKIKDEKLQQDIDRKAAKIPPSAGKMKKKLVKKYYHLITVE